MNPCNCNSISVATAASAEFLILVSVVIKMWSELSINRKLTDCGDIEPLHGGNDWFPAVPAATLFPR